MQTLPRRAMWMVWATLAACAPASHADLAAEARALEAPAEPAVPEGVTFGPQVTLRGSGCSAASAVPLVREDGKTATVYFEQFAIELLDQDAAVSADCTLGYDIQVPPGYTYSVTQVFYNLQAQVPEGVEARVRIDYGFAGEPLTVGSELRLPANRPDEPVRPHGIAHRVTQTAWAPCDAPRTFEAKVSIALTNTSPPTYAKLEMIQSDARTNPEGESAIGLSLTWAKCPELPR